MLVARAFVGTLLGALCLLRFSGTARACSESGPNVHQILPSEVGVDVTPPEPPVVTTGVSRSFGPRTTGCVATAASSCDGSGSIHFMIEPGQDDRTPAKQLGYLIHLVGGKPPPGFSAPEQALVPLEGGLLFVSFPDPGPSDQKAFDAVFELVAVDDAGNESEPSAPVHARDGGDEGGCAVRTLRSRNRIWPGMAALLALTALARRYTRRRAARSSR